MNNLYTFNEFLNETYIQLNESFKSMTLSQFVAAFPAQKNYVKLPKGIHWDQIPEEEVIVGSSMDDAFKKEVKKEEYVVFWYNDTKQLIKYRPPVFTKWGSKMDKSSYLRAHFMFMTRGNKFLTDVTNINNATIATTKWEKPGDLSTVKEVYDELKLSAIAIKWDTLMSYSSAELLKLRKTQKEGALALQKIQNILNQNERRYREYAQKAKIEKGTREITLRTEEKLNSITAEMDRLSSISTYDLFNINFNEWGEDKFGKFEFNHNYIKKLESLANEYNQIANAYSTYYEYFKKSFDKTDPFYKNKFDRYTEILINLID